MHVSVSEREGWGEVFIALMILFVVLGIELIPALLIPGERLFLFCQKQVDTLIPSSGPFPP